MKTFLFKGEMKRIFGPQITIEAKTIREALAAIFALKKGFKKYYLNQMLSGVDYVFVDSKNNVFESFCSDLLLEDKTYTISPNFQASAGAALAFGTNALVGYGMQKIANKLAPVESTGEEYEIITTNSFIYSSNENRTEQGLPIPVVYGQLRVGSLTVNSSISNYDFNFDNLTIYENQDPSSYTLPNIGEFNFFSQSQLKELKSDRPATLNNPRQKGGGGDPSKRNISFDKNGVKTFSEDLGNESYNDGYIDKKEQGGHRVTYGPGASFADDSPSKHTGGKSSKTELFPQDGVDYYFRPQSKNDYCITVDGNNVSPLQVGDRGDYTKLESVGIFRSVDILSEGPIAGLAFHPSEPPSYNTSLGSFENDNAIVSYGLTPDSIFIFSQKQAFVGNITFDNDVNNTPANPFQHFIDKNKFEGEDIKSNQLTITHPGSGYTPFTGLITGNLFDSTQPIQIKIDNPSSSNDSDIGGIGFDNDALNGYYISDSNLFALSASSSGELSLNFESSFITPHIITKTFTDPDTQLEVTVTGLNLENIQDANIENSEINIGDGYSANEDIDLTFSPDNAASLLEPTLKLARPMPISIDKAKALDLSYFSTNESDLLFLDESAAFTMKDDLNQSRPSSAFSNWSKFARLYCDGSYQPNKAPISNYSDIKPFFAYVGYKKYSHIFFDEDGIRRTRTQYDAIYVRIKFEDYIYLRSAEVGKTWNLTSRDTLPDGLDTSDPEHRSRIKESPDFLSSQLSSTIYYAYYDFHTNGGDIGAKDSFVNSYLLFAHLDTFGDSLLNTRIDVGLLLRNKDFANKVFNFFKNPVSNNTLPDGTAIPTGFTAQATTLPDSFDSKGERHRGGSYLRFCPATGSSINNRGLSTYITSLSDPNTAYSSSSSANCAITENGDGKYEPNLVYRVEVRILRETAISFNGGTTFSFLHTNIQAFASIDEDGNVEGIFVTHLPESPVYNNGEWTPILCKGLDGARYADPFGSTDNGLGVSNTSSYSDIGVYFNIDTPHQSMDISLKLDDGDIDALALKRWVSANFSWSKSGSMQERWSAYTKQSSDDFGLDIAHGIRPNRFGYRWMQVHGFNSQNVQKNPRDRFGELKVNIERIDLSSQISDISKGLVVKSNRNPFRPLKQSFYTGRVHSIEAPVQSHQRYLDSMGNLAAGQRINFTIYNDCFELQSIGIDYSQDSNIGYKPNSEITLNCGLNISKRTDGDKIIDIFGNSLVQHPKSNKKTRYSILIKLHTDSYGKITDSEIINRGYHYQPISVSKDFNAQTDTLRTVKENANVRLEIPTPLHAGLNGSFLNLNEDLFIGSQNATPPLTYERPTDSLELDNLGYLDPEINFPKQDFELKIFKEDLQEGSISKIFTLNPGLGFTRSFLSESVAPTLNSNLVAFNVEINSLGQIHQMSIDHSQNIEGYSLSDSDVSIEISPPSTEEVINLQPDIPATSSWARSIYLNSTPIQDKNGLFNFTKFEFDFAGGYKQNSQTYNGGIAEGEITKTARKNLLEEEFRIPAQTHNINYKLYGPRNNEEKDYFYTHTIKNPEISAVTLSFKINQLQYIYEGDESVVYLNLNPIVAGILGFIVGKMLASKAAAMIVQDPQATQGGAKVQVNPCTGTGGGKTIAAGMNPPTLSGAAEHTSLLSMAGAITALGALLGAIAAFSLAKDVPCNGPGNFLCIKMGEIIKNSGEVWPAKLLFKIEYGIEGDLLETKHLAIKGCATNPYIKDVVLNLKDLRSDSSNAGKNIIIQIYRITREMDPVNNGILDARFSLDAELFSVTEYVAGFFSYPNTALVATRVNARDMPQLPKREYLVKGKLLKIPNGYSPETGTYSSAIGNPESFDSFFSSSLRWTSNPAWIIYDLLTNPIYGLGKYGITDDQIDRWSFLEFSKRADEPVDVIINNQATKERRYMCNLYLDTEREAFNYINELMVIYDASINFSGDKIYITSDKPSDPVMILTNANVSQEGFSYSTIPQTNRITAVTVDYIDERDNYMQKTEYIEESEGIRKYGYSHQKIAGIGITRKGEANRLAMSKLMNQKMETEVIEFTIGLHGGYLRIGDVIEVMDNKKISQHSGGRIMSRVNDSTIEIDVPVDAINNATKIYIQKFASSSESSESAESNRPAQYSEYTIASTNGFEVTVDSDLHESVQSSYVWMVKNHNDDNGDPITSKQYRIKEISESENSKYKIIAIMYNPEKYKYIDQPISSSDDESEEYIGHQISTSDLNA